MNTLLLQCECLWFEQTGRCDCRAKCHYFDIHREAGGVRRRPGGGGVAKRGGGRRTRGARYLVGQRRGGGTREGMSAK